jgi:1,5-anhydro-D-fructose reductase (1,5-anhydro-D-mannitol-forming)
MLFTTSCLHNTEYDVMTKQNWHSIMAHKMKFIQGEIHWGIIGAGNVCEKKSGPAFHKVRHSHLTAVMRRNEEKAKDYAFRHNVPKYYSNAEDLIYDREINAIYIATPPSFHEEFTLAALKAGKPVYVEKPVALNAASCKRMIDASVKHNLPVTVAHYRRGLPLFNTIKELLNEDRIGKVLFVTIRTFQTPVNDLVANANENWRVVPELSGGGIFHDLAPHQLDLMYWYFGPPIKIQGFSANQGGNYNAPDLTMLGISFDQNIYLNGMWSFAIHQSADTERCEIIGEKGKLAFSFFRSPLLEVYTDDGLNKLEFPFPEHIQQPMIEKTVAFFRGEGDNPCSLEDALVSIQMMDSTL